MKEIIFHLFIALFHLIKARLHLDFGIVRSFCQKEDNS